MSDEKLTELNAKLDRIENELAKQRSFKRQAIRAILTGVFGSFGATIVFAIILIVLANMIKSAEQIPILNEIIERTKLEQIVDNYNDVPVEGEIEESTQSQ